MPDYAIIGLLMLVPLEIVILLVLYAVKTKPAPKPTIEIPQPKKLERYGWEDFLKLPEDGAERSPKKPVKLTKVLVLLLILAMLPVLFVLSLSFGLLPDVVLNQSFDLLPDFMSNLSIDALIQSNQTQDDTQGDVNELPLENMQPDETDIRAQNDTGLNITGFIVNSISSYSKYIYAVLIAIGLLLAGLGAFILFIKYRRKLAVIIKARKTAEKLIKRIEKPKGENKQLARIKGLLRKFARLFNRRLLTHAVPLFIVIGAGLLIYLVYSEIDVWTWTKDLVLLYKYYVAGGIILLVAAIVFIHFLRRKR